MSVIRFLVGVVRHLVVPVAILAVLGYVTVQLVLSSPEVPKEVFKGAPPVCEFVTAKNVVSPTWVEGQGTVIPHRTWTLQTEVGGAVVMHHDGLVAGGRVGAGEKLLEVDRREFALAAEQAAAELARALFEVEVERGRGAVAQREWKLLENSIETTDEGRLLALRVPHLRQREAAVAAARAMVERSALDLERTVVVAPFNAMVVEESVDVGQVISPRMPLARMVCIDEYHVRVSLPLARLGGVVLRDGDRPGSSVDVVQRLDDGTERSWRGEVERILGDVGDQGRQARLLVRVDDPLASSDENGARTPLLLGSYVIVRITGPELTDVVAIDRDHLRDDQAVWLIDDEDRLVIRAVDVVGRSAGFVYVRGIEDGERVVTTPLVSVDAGMQLSPRAAEVRR